MPISIKNLKDKVVRHRTEILGVIGVTALAAAAIVVVVTVAKALNSTPSEFSLKDINLTDIRLNNEIVDLGSLEQTNELFDMIGEASYASITSITENDFILFVSK